MPRTTPRPKVPAELVRTKRLTGEELEALAVERFGTDPRWWTFGCPSCGELHDAGDFLLADADPNRVGQECIGRSLGALSPAGVATRGCNWCAYGLFRGPWLIAVPGRDPSTGAVDPDAPVREVGGFALATVSRDSQRSDDERAAVRAAWTAREQATGGPEDIATGEPSPQTDGPAPQSTGTEPTGPDTGPEETP